MQLAQDASEIVVRLIPPGAPGALDPCQLRVQRGEGKVQVACQDLCQGYVPSAVILDEISI